MLLVEDPHGIDRIPTYLGLSNWTVLTRPPLWTSSVGINRGAASDLPEILQQLHTPVMALLGMELRPENVAGTYRRGEPVAVVGRAQDGFLGLRAVIVRVQKIIPRSLDTTNKPPPTLGDTSFQPM